MSLTLAEAERAIQAAKAEAERLGVKVSVFVSDKRGDLMAAIRMDGVPWYTTLVSRGKAIASSMFGRNSGEMTERASNPVLQSLVAMHAGTIVLGQGGVPIKRGDEVIGGVGASGASAQEDEDISAAGAKAV